MVEIWSKKGNSNFTADDLPTVSEFLLQGWSKNAKWKCFRVAEQLQLRERRAQLAMRVPSICQSICPSFPTHPSIHPPPLRFGLPCAQICSHINSNSKGNV